MTIEADLESRMQAIASRAEALSQTPIDFQRLNQPATAAQVFAVSQALGGAMTRILKATTLMVDGRSDAARVELVEATGAMLNLAELMQLLFGNSESTDR